MKKLLILGNSGAQKDVIEVAKEMGIYTIAVAKEEERKFLSLNDSYDSIKPDKYISINILDEEKLDNLIKEEGIDAVFTGGLEIAIPIMTKLSIKNNLRYFVTEKSIEMFKDKAEWRKAIGDTVGNIKFMAGYTLEDFKYWNTFPAVIKPSDGSGQRGVHKVNSFEEIEEVFDNVLNFSKNKKAIIEEFIGGEEISINSFMYNGEIAFYELSDRISHKEYPGGIIKEHYIPSKYDTPEIRKKLEQIILDVSRAMEYKYGHVYYQIKIDDGEPKIIEFTPRYDACHMWRLVKYANNINLIKASLEYLLYGKSEEIENYKYKLNEGNYKLIFIQDKPNIRVEKEKYNIPKDNLYIKWYYNNNENIKKVTGYIEKLGYYIIKE